MKRILLCTNWKMNLSVTESVDYAKKLKDFTGEMIPEDSKIEIFIFPDFLALYPVSQVLTKSKVRLGAQNCFWEDRGAFTGEISPLSLKDINCTYAMAGHPERVNYFKEDFKIVNKKAKAILDNNMSPVLFVAETEKKDNMKHTSDMLKSQLFPLLDGIDKKELSKIVIIYEPTWAIGTGEPASVKHTGEVLSALRESIDSQFGKGAGERQLFMYGGGVTLESAKERMSLDNIDGIGMGKAGLNFNFFTGAIKIAIELEKNLK